MLPWSRVLLVAAFAVAVGCGSDDSGGGGSDGSGATAAGGLGGGAGGNAAGGAGVGGASGGSGGNGGGGVDCAAMSDNCASQFGALFTNSNGRADGTLVALLEPTDTQCTLFNDDHAVLQLSIAGQVQRLVVAIDDVAVTTVSAALVGPAFSDGWHENVHLDYPSDLGAHSPDFDSVSMDDSVQFLCSHLQIGAPVSVYAYSDGSAPSSAHQIHRNNNYPDGAIVAAPTSASPLYLLFRYDNQVF